MGRGGQPDSNRTDQEQKRKQTSKGDSLALRPALPSAENHTPLARPASMSWHRLSGLIQPYLSDERAGQNRTSESSVNVLLKVPMGQLVAPSVDLPQRKQGATEEETGFWLQHTDILLSASPDA